MYLHFKKAATFQMMYHNQKNEKRKNGKVVPDILNGTEAEYEKLVMNLSPLVRLKAIDAINKGAHHIWRGMTWKERYDTIQSQMRQAQAQEIKEISFVTKKVNNGKKAIHNLVNNFKTISIEKDAHIQAALLKNRTMKRQFSAKKRLNRRLTSRGGDASVVPTPTYIQIHPLNLTTPSKSINKLAVAYSTELTVNKIEKTRRGSLNTVLTKQKTRQVSSQIRVQERVAMRQKNKIEEVEFRKKKLNELLKLKRKIFNIKKFAEQTREMKNRVIVPEQTREMKDRVIVLKKINILVSESKGAPGINIEDREGDMVVLRVMKNGLAAQAGVVKGYTLLSIGGKSVKGTSLRKVDNAIRRSKFMQREINFLFEEGEKGKIRKKSVTRVQPSMHERKQTSREERHANIATRTQAQRATSATKIQTRVRTHQQRHLIEYKKKQEIKKKSVTRVRPSLHERKQTSREERHANIATRTQTQRATSATKIQARVRTHQQRH